jgi:hypothetical protein
MIFDFEGGEAQRVLGQEIVLVQECAPFTGRQTERGVRARGDVTVLLAEDEFDPRIARRDFFEKRPDFRMGRSIVRDAKFPVFVELTLE